MLKSLLGALALIVAAPVAAQEAPAAADPHAGHAEHGQQHGEMQHPDAPGQAGQMMDCCRKCCDQAPAEGKKMSCCDESGDEQGEASPEGAADHSQHGT